MFNLERGLRYWLYSEPTDMRKSFHTLSGLVRNKIGGEAATQVHGFGESVNRHYP